MLGKVHVAVVLCPPYLFQLELAEFFIILQLRGFEKDPRGIMMLMITPR